MASPTLDGSDVGPPASMSQLSVRVAARTGAQRATSDRTKRSNAAGLRSALAGIEPPSLASVSLTAGSSSALSSASASLATISGGTPVGANSPAQTLMS